MGWSHVDYSDVFFSFLYSHSNSTHIYIYIYIEWNKGLKKQDILKKQNSWENI